MTAEAAGVFLDYSKNRIDDETLRLLVELAEQCLEQLLPFALWAEVKLRGGIG